MPAQKGKNVASTQGNHPDVDPIEGIAKKLMAEEESTRQSAFVELGDFQNTPHHNAQMADQSIGTILINILQKASGTERTSALGCIAKLQEWRGRIGKQLAVPSSAEVLWEQLQYHHRETEAFKNAPPPPEPEPEPVKGNKQKKGKEPPPVEEPAPGLADKELGCALRALTTGVSMNGAYAREIYDHDMHLLGTLLESKKADIKVQTLRLMRVLTRNAPIIRCFSRCGFIKQLVSLLEPDLEPGQEENAQDIAMGALGILKLISSDGGASHAQLLAEDMLRKAMRIVAPQESPEEVGRMPENGSRLQEASLEFVLEFVKNSYTAAQQAISSGVVDVIVSLLPSPDPDSFAKYITCPASMMPSLDQTHSNGPSDTIFASLASPKHKDHPDTEEEEEAASVAKFDLAQAKTTSPRVCTICLQLLGVLFARDPVIRTSPNSASAVPWHNLMLFFLEKEAPQRQVSKESEEAEAPPKKGDKPKGKKAPEAEPEHPPVEMCPPFSTQIRAAASYCLNELARGPLVAEELLHSKDFLPLLLECTAMEKQSTFPHDAVHHAAHLMSTLTTHIVGRNCGPEINCKLEHFKLMDTLKTLSRRLLENSVTDELSVTKRQLARASLGIDAEAFQPPVRPPLPSPPPTPPPPLLPTSQFIWDALGRPVMNDGLLLRTL